MTTLTVEAFFNGMEALTQALNRVADNQERLIKGQEAAIEKLEGAKPTSTRGRKAKEPVEEAAPAAAAVEPEAPTATFPHLTIKTEDALKAHISAWTGGTEDAAEKAARVQFLKDMAAEFGCAPKFSEFAAEPERLKKSVFYVDRKKAGLPVDFGADYDFDGDPAQGVSDDSDFG